SDRVRRNSGWVGRKGPPRSSNNCDNRDLLADLVPRSNGPVKWQDIWLFFSQITHAVHSAPLTPDSCALMRFCQWLQMNQITAATIITPMTASNLWKYLPSLRQFSPSFMPSQARPRHHGHDPRNV